MLFIALEKPYDIIPRNVRWYCLGIKNVPEVFIDIAKNMYEDSITLANITVGETGEMEIKVGLHQGAAISQLLFNYNHGRHH